MKKYKIIFSLWKSPKGTERNRLSHEEREEIIKDLIKQYSSKLHFFFNKNKRKDKHYPIYYDDVYYFGEPIVITGIDEEKIKIMFEYFKSLKLFWWVTSVYKMYNFGDIRVMLRSNKLNNLKMVNMNKERDYLFISNENLINMYKLGKGIIQNNTEINKIIEETK